MSKFNVYIFTKAGNKSRYAMSENNKISLMRDYYDNNARGISKVIVECEVTGVVVTVPVENIDFIQCQKISD